jgi:hypothetical protein
LRRQRDVDGFKSLRCAAIADCIEAGKHREGETE